MNFETAIIAIENKANNSNVKNEAFEYIISSTSWKDQQKSKLKAAEFIPTNIRPYAELHEIAINAQLDLCEDNDVKYLPEFSRSAPQYAARIADVLLQLLQADDNNELKIVKVALLRSFQLFPKDSTEALFYQIQSGFSGVRDEACKFMIQHLLPATAASLKQKFFQRFLSILPSANLLPSSYEVIMALMPACKTLGSEEYNSSLVILLEKISHQKAFRSVRIREVSAFYNDIFKAGQCSFAFFNFCTKYSLDLLQSDLRVFRLFVDNLEYLSDASKLHEIVPYIESCVISLSNNLENDYDSTLQNLEPLLHCILYYRIVARNASKDNSPNMLLSLRAIFAASQEVKSRILCDKPDLSNEKLFECSKSVFEYVKELLKERHHSTFINFIPSWRLEARQSPVIKAKIVPKILKVVATKPFKSTQPAPIYKLQPPLLYNSSTYISNGKAPLHTKNFKANSLAPRSKFLQTTKPKVEQPMKPKFEPVRVEKRSLLSQKRSLNESKKKLMLTRAEDEEGRSGRGDLRDNRNEHRISITRNAFHSNQPPNYIQTRQRLPPQDLPSKLMGLQRQRSDFGMNRRVVRQ